MQPLAQSPTLSPPNSPICKIAYPVTCSDKGSTLPAVTQSSNDAVPATREFVESLLEEMQQGIQLTKDDIIGVIAAAQHQLLLEDEAQKIIEIDVDVCDLAYEVNICGDVGQVIRAS